MHEKKQRGSTCFAGNPVFFKDLVSGLGPEVKRDVSLILQERTFEAGNVVIARGEPALDLYLLRSGKALLVVETGEGTTVTREIATGEIFGLPEAVAGPTYDTMVVARSFCRFESAAGSDLTRVLHLHPSLCFRLVTLLGTNLNEGRQIFTSTTI
ncbi:MAG TPA: cyclic nucleotide-binding domain-containing protein [Aridibacter sp.]|nr:cyclic nucleotide-binding domain-containing protein [Aridibacter sp.]